MTRPRQLEVRRHRWWGGACVALTLLASACGTSHAATDGTSPSTTHTSSTTATHTSKDTTRPAAAPTPTKPTVSVADLAAGLLNPQEMKLIFTAQGTVQALPPRSMLQVSACGSGRHFASFKATASLIGVYQTAQQPKDVYWSYLGYYPGHGAEVFASSKVPSRCSHYVVTNPGAGLSPFRVVRAKPAAADRHAPPHTRLLGFSDSQGASYHEAYVQKGDYVLELFYVTSQGFSDRGMSRYIAYSLNPFLRLTTTA